jgi:hydroxyquinol 1,2-dioxygenase
MATDDPNIKTITEAVIAARGDDASPRLSQIIDALVRHAHDFVREVGLTEDEWAEAIRFLTATGQLCTPTRQEFILLSDVLGITMLVDAVNNRRAPEATENSVLGPFFREDRPEFADGADISPGMPGTPMFFEGRVVDEESRPVAGATVDVWHSDADGHYDVDVPGQAEPTMRGTFRTGEDGAFTFRTIRPASYPIPGDGTVGELLRGLDRSPMRPAHLHFLLDAPGFQRVTTMLFPDDDPYLGTDPVFGVKRSLVTTYEDHETHTSLHHTFVLEPTRHDA